MFRCIQKENASLCSSYNNRKKIEGFVETGFDQELKAHEDVYKNMWENADIQITGDDELNRAVRFNIFHLMSTGNEHDDHVNVGAKLLTGKNMVDMLSGIPDFLCFRFLMGISEDCTESGKLQIPSSGCSACKCT